MTSKRGMNVLAAIFATLSVCALSSCGSETSGRMGADEAGRTASAESNGTPSAATEDGPANCRELVGTVMSADFAGCRDRGKVASPIKVDCNDGRSIVLAGPIYGYVGEPIKLVDSSGRAYSSIVGCNDLL